MAKVIVDLPGLEAHHAKALVNMALAEWRLRREGGYVERRYAHMDQPHRLARHARLAHELAALDKLDLDTAP